MAFEENDASHEHWRATHTRRTSTVQTSEKIGLVGFIFSYLSIGRGGPKRSR